MTSSVGYYGLSLSAGGLTGNRYLNIFISSFVELPAFAMIIYVLRRYSSRFCSFPPCHQPPDWMWFWNGFTLSTQVRTEVSSLFLLHFWRSSLHHCRNNTSQDQCVKFWYISSEDLRVYQGCFWHCIRHDKCSLSWHALGFYRGYIWKIVWSHIGPAQHSPYVILAQGF